MGVHIKRHEIANSHEEADVIVVNQVMSAARQGRHLTWRLYYYFYHN